jgi:hypothetical protein
MRTKEEIIKDIQKAHFELEIAVIYKKIAAELQKKSESFVRKDKELEARLKNPKLSEDQQTALSKQLITVIRSEYAYSKVEKMVLSQAYSIIDPDSDVNKKLKELMAELNMIENKIEK